MSTTPTDPTTAALKKLEERTSREGVIEWVTEGKERRRKCQIKTGRTDGLAVVQVMKPISVDNETKRPSSTIRDDFGNLKVDSKYRFVDDHVIEAIERFRKQLRSMRSDDQPPVSDKTDTRRYAQRLTRAVTFNVLVVAKDEESMYLLAAALDQLASDLRQPQ